MKKNKRKIIKEKAGELGHIDCHYLSKGVLPGSKRKYLVGVIDACTRISWVELVDDITSLTVMFAILRCLNMLQVGSDTNDEYIILKNVSTNTIDISNWILMNGKLISSLAIIPQGTVLSSGATLQINLSGSHLGNVGDNVLLTLPDGLTAVDMVYFEGGYTRQAAPATWANEQAGCTRTDPKAVEGEIIYRINDVDHDDCSDWGVKVF